ncbi:hypothetical protein HAX54_008849, partial [Datura stramonium]|nr:hypothetical protein [Datura stramonium]
KGTLPSDTVPNPRNEGHCMAIITRKEIVLEEEPTKDKNITIEKELIEPTRQASQQSKKKAKE